MATARKLTLSVCAILGSAVTAAAAGAEGGSAVPIERLSVRPTAFSRLLQIQTHPEQTHRSHENWGSVLTDIARRLPTTGTYQDAFIRYTREGDLVTAGHEWTHFLNAYLSSRAGSGKSAFYMLEGRYVTLTIPDGLRGVVPHVPPSLRGVLYDLYLVQNSGNAQVDPLYLLDEWTAYANDVTIAVDQLNRGKPLNPFNPTAIQPEAAGNVLEFMFYGFALGMAVKQYDPAYYQSYEGRRLRDFIALTAYRSLDIHAKGVRWREINRGDSRNTTLLSHFRNAADTAAMRAWVTSDLGEDLARRLGIDTSAPTERRMALSHQGQAPGLN
jgi:hypothetical protein